MQVEKAWKIFNENTEEIPEDLIEEIREKLNKNLKIAHNKFKEVNSKNKV